MSKSKSKSKSKPKTLAFEPGSWTVTLKEGAQITIRADGFSQSEDSYDFSLYIEGEPMEIFECVSIPARLIENVEGGPVLE